MIKLSAALATYNEESNITECLTCISGLVDEIIVVDGTSSDRTVEIAKSFGARIEVQDNPPIFHINKQRAFDLCHGEWILYLDADERVTADLAEEIKEIINYNLKDAEQYQQKIKNKKLFERHLKLIEQRDGRIGFDEGEYVAFFVPRLNFFLGKYLRYGGVYPDGVIRLFKKNKAYLPCKSVHEQMVVEGKVGWLSNDLLHEDSPTFKRYLEKNNRYINLIKLDLVSKRVKKDIKQSLNYFLIKPLWWFLLTQIRHKGILDGYQGIIFSFFSALRFPRAYFRYLKGGK